MAAPDFCEMVEVIESLTKNKNQALNPSRFFNYFYRQKEVRCDIVLKISSKNK